MAASPWDIVEEEPIAAAPLPQWEVVEEEPIGAIPGPIAPVVPTTDRGGWDVVSETPIGPIGSAPLAHTAPLTPLAPTPPDPAKALRDYHLDIYANENPSLYKLATDPEDRRIKAEKHMMLNAPDRFNQIGAKIAGVAPPPAVDPAVALSMRQGPSGAVTGLREPHQLEAQRLELRNRAAQAAQAGDKDEVNRLMEAEWQLRERLGGRAGALESPQSLREKTIGPVESAIGLGERALLETAIAKPVSAIDAALGAVGYDTRMGETISKRLAEATPTKPSTEQSFVGGALPQATGSAAGFLFGGGLGKIGTGVQAVAQGIGHSYEEARDTDATPAQKTLYTLVGGAIGATEAIPIERFIGKMDPNIRGPLTAKMLDKLRSQSAKGLTRNMVEGAATQALAESFQEAGQGVAQNAAAKFFGVDPNRNLFDGVSTDTLAAMVVGGAMGGAAEVPAQANRQEVIRREDAKAAEVPSILEAPPAPPKPSQLAQPGAENIVTNPPAPPTGQATGQQTGQTGQPTGQVGTQVGMPTPTGHAQTPPDKQVADSTKVRTKSYEDRTKSVEGPTGQAGHAPSAPVPDFASMTDDDLMAQAQKQGIPPSVIMKGRGAVVAAMGANITQGQGAQDEVAPSRLLEVRQQTQPTVRAQSASEIPSADQAPLPALAAASLKATDRGDTESVTASAVDQSVPLQPQSETSESPSPPIIPTTPPTKEAENVQETPQAAPAVLSEADQQAGIDADLADLQGHVRSAKDHAETTLRAVDPATDAENYVVALAQEKFGTKVVLVDGGKPLPRGGYSGKTSGVVFVDKNASDEVKLLAVTAHEITHDLQKREADLEQQAHDELEANAPLTLAAARQSYREAAEREGVPYNERAESVPVVAEDLALDILYGNTQAIARAATSNPTLLQKVWDSMVRVLRKMGLNLGPTGADRVRNTADMARAVTAVRRMFLAASNRTAEARAAQADQALSPGSTPSTAAQANETNESGIEQEARQEAGRLVYTITRAPDNPDIAPLSDEDAVSEIDDLIERAQRGQDISSTLHVREIGQRLDTGGLAVLRQLMKQDPVAALTALKNRIAERASAEKRKGAAPPPPAAQAATPETGKSATPRGGQVDGSEDGRVVRMKTADLVLDPARMQYKVEGVGDGGAASLRDVQTWDVNKAGVILAWRDPQTGQTIVVNGHGRTNAAKRLGVEALDVRYVNAETAKQARAIGAEANIAEGRGTPIDAAKYMRDSGVTAQELESRGVSMTESMARQGAALSKLSQPLFDQVVNQEMSIKRGAAIGDGLPNEADQAALMGLIERAEQRGKKITDDVVKELIDLTRGAERVTVDDGPILWGNDERQENTALAEAELSDWTRKMLGRVKRALGAVADTEKAGIIQEKQVGKIDVQKAKVAKQDAATYAEYYDTLKPYKGGVNDAIKDGARRIAAGEDRAHVRTDVIKRVRAAIDAKFGQRAVPEVPAGSAQPDPRRGAELPEPSASAPQQRAVEEGTGGQGTGDFALDRNASAQQVADAWVQDSLRRVPDGGDTARRYAHNFIRRLALRLEKSDWSTPVELTAAYRNGKRDIAQTSRDLESLRSLGYAHRAWDRNGETHYARADKPLPSWLTQSENDEDLAKLPARGAFALERQRGTLPGVESTGAGRTPKPQEPQRHEGVDVTPLRSAFNKYDDTGEYTARDLADKVDALIVEGAAPESLREPLDDYRQAIAEDFGEYAGRGDVEPSERRFIEAVRSALGGQRELQPAPAPPASSIDVSPVMEARSLDDVYLIGGRMLAVAKDAGSLATIQNAIKRRATELSNPPAPAQSGGDFALPRESSQTQLTLAGEREGRATVGGTPSMFGVEPTRRPKPVEKIEGPLLPLDADKFNVGANDVRAASAFQAGRVSGAFTYGVKRYLNGHSGIAKVEGMSKAEATEALKGFKAAKAGASSVQREGAEAIAERTERSEREGKETGMLFALDRAVADDAKYRRFEQMHRAAQNRHEKLKEAVRAMLDPDKGGAFVYQKDKAYNGQEFSRLILASRNTYSDRDKYPWRFTYYDTLNPQGKPMPSGHETAKSYDELIGDIADWIRGRADRLEPANFALDRRDAKVGPAPMFALDRNATDAQVVAAAGLVVKPSTTRDGRKYWYVVGKTGDETYTHKGLLDALGAAKPWKGPDGWRRAFFNLVDSPVSSIANALRVGHAGRPTASGPASVRAGQQPSGVGAGVQALAASDARRSIERLADGRRSDADAASVVSGGTRGLIFRGEQFGIPQSVLTEQVADIGHIVGAYRDNKRLFILGNEAGSGKTFVLGGAIRELRAAGQQKFIYITMNQDLIGQIADDLSAYGIGGVEFVTYSDLSTKGPRDTTGAVVIFDEAHNIKNVEDSRRARIGQQMIGQSRFAVLSSATPFENPTQAQYLEPTGIFEPVGGFGDFATALGADRKTIRVRGKYGPMDKIIYVWDSHRAGSADNAKLANRWLMHQGIMVQRKKRLDPGMVDASFSKVDIGRDLADFYAAVDSAYGSAVGAFPPKHPLRSRISMHRMNALKRIAEASKMDAAIAKVGEHLRAGRRVAIFVETKSERHYGRYRRKSRSKQTDPTYAYPEIAAIMADWEHDAARAQQMHDTPPPRPFAGEVVEIARAMHDAGIDRQIPSVPEYVAEKLKSLYGTDVGFYTGGVTAAKAANDKEAWLNGGKRILLVTMAKGGTGLSLHPKRPNDPIAQINLNLPWTATGVEQVSGRGARYGMASHVTIDWLFAGDIGLERQIARKVGGRMRDMGATVKGRDVEAAEALVDFNFEDTFDASSMAVEKGASASTPPVAEKQPESQAPKGPPARGRVKDVKDQGMLFALDRRQTKTPEFARWFGDSKVVDSKGEPLVVYHGTAAWEDFDAFEVGRVGTNTTVFGPEDVTRWAIFFTDEPAFTSQYDKGKSQASRTIPTYLAIKNPIDMRPTASGADFDAAVEKLASEGISERWLRNGPDQTWEMFDHNQGREFVEASQRAGYDGAIFLERGVDGKDHTVYAAFRPEQIKSATANRGTFDPASPNMNFALPRTAPTFYSQLLRTTESFPKPETKMTPAQFKGWLSKQPVKAEEIKWTGLDEFLAGKEKVTAKEIAEHIRANEVRVEEVVKGGSKPLPDAEYDRYVALRHRQGDLSEAELDEFQDLQSRMVPVDTKFPSFTLPGGQNYRELLLTLPVADTQAERDAAKVRRIRAEGGRAYRAENSPSFRSSHWDTPNVLAHVRFDDRTTADGKRTLHIAEVQSDWAAQAREKGVRGGNSQAAKDRLVEAHKKLVPMLQSEDNWGFDSTGKALIAILRHDDFAKRWDTNAQTEAAANEYRAARQDSDAFESGVPDAPYIKSTEAYTTLAMRRMIRYASENGFDSISWDTGAINAERYDLSKQVDKIKAESVAEADGVHFVDIRVFSGEDIHLEVEGGKVRDGGDEAGLIGKPLSEVIGKDMADKILSIPKGEFKTFSGPDLRVGGHGMTAFYDSILPSVANKIGKKWGARTTTATLSSGDKNVTVEESRSEPGRWVVKGLSASGHHFVSEPFATKAEAEADAGRGITVHSLPITDSMRKSVVEEGQPQFALTRAYHGSPHTFDRFSTEKIGTGEGAQAYGHGLYFSGKKEVAEYYRDKLAGERGKDLWLLDGKPIRDQNSALYSALGFNRGESLEKTIEALEDEVRWRGDNPQLAPELYRHSADILKKHKDRLKPIPARLYHVDLAPEAEDYLLWDKPLSEQSEKVRKAIRDGNLSWGSHQKGEQFYEGVAIGQHVTGQGASDAQRASAYLHSLGIRGIKYLDQMSRSDGDGQWMVTVRDSDDGAYHDTRFEKEEHAEEYAQQMRDEGHTATVEKSDRSYNYVIFDDKDVAITAMFSLHRKTPLIPGLFGADAYQRTGGRPSTSRGQTALFDDGFSVPSESATDAVIRHVQDRLRPVLTLQRHLEAVGGRITEESDVYLAEELRRGKTKDREERFDQEHVQPLVKFMGKAKVDQATGNLLIMARHAPERNRVMSQKRGEVGAWSGMTTQVAEAIMQAASEGRKFKLRDKFDGGTVDLPDVEIHGEKLPGMAKVYDEIGQRFDAMNKATRKNLLDAGLITQELADTLDSMYQHYAPLRSDLDEDDGHYPKGTGRGVDIRGKEFKRAVGRTTMASNPLAYAVVQATTTIMRAEKASVGQSFLKLVRENPDKNLWKIGVPERKLIVGEDGMVRYAYDPTYKTADNVVSVKENGKEIHITIDKAHAEIARAMKNLGAEDSGKITQLMGRATRTLAALSTRWNPAFTPFNMVRDWGTAAIHLAGEKGLTMAAKVTAGIPKAWIELYKGIRGVNQSEDYKRYVANGGPIAFLDLGGLDDTVRGIEKSLKEIDPGNLRQGMMFLRSIGRFFGTINDVVENASRFAAFKELTKAGMSDKRAAAYAKNLTTNFERKGEVGNTINAWYMFANAGIQGTARVGHAMKHPGVQAIVGGTVISAVLLDIANRVLGGEDDDGEEFYDKVPEFEKQRSMILMYPDGSGRYLAIPMPFVYRWFHYLGTQIGAATHGGKSAVVGAKDLAVAAVGELNPLGEGTDLLGTLTPTPADPIMQAGRNKDWAGRLIMPDYGTKPDSQKYWPSVSPSLKAVTAWLNKATGGDSVAPGYVDVSPEMIEHFGQFITGGLGRTVQQLLTLGEKAIVGEPFEKREVPIVGRVFKSPNPWAERRLFKDNLKDAEMRYKQIVEARKAGESVRARELQAQHGKLSGLTKYLRATDRTIGKLLDQADVAKGEEKKRLEAQWLKMVKRANRKVNEAANKVPAQ